MSFVLFNRYRGKIGAFYNRSSKCTFVRSRYEFDISFAPYILMSSIFYFNFR